MAYITTQYCHYCRCNQLHMNGSCNTCRDRIFRENEAIWKVKTDSEKIDELRKRIEKLENNNIRYS